MSRTYKKNSRNGKGSSESRTTLLHESKQTSLRDLMMKSRRKVKRDHGLIGSIE